MKIMFYDGKEFNCNQVYFDGKTVVADDIYVFPLIEILRIVSN